jgi:peptidoglycan/LPS O-acetylase OafA/YrhL
MFSLDRSKNDTSVMLDLLRAVAAQMVCVGHGVSFFVSQWAPSQLPRMQNVGVLLFFLISGFLITYTLIDRSKDPHYDFWRFCVERFARIYSGLLPALALVIIVDGIVIYWTNDTTVSRYFTLKTLIANLFMLEAYRGIFPNVLQWAAFGSASPLWTLAIEWHIYMFVGAAFFLIARRGTLLFLVPLALFYGQTPVHFLLGSFQADGVGQGLFALWLGGALVYIAAPFMVDFRAAAAIGLCGGVAFMALAHTGNEYDMKTYPVLALAFFGIVAATQSQHRLTSPILRKSITFFADYSFTLYLVHHTIMYAMWITSPERGVTRMIVAILISNLVAIGLAAIGEKHHRKLAKAINRRLFAKQEKTVATIC